MRNTRLTLGVTTDDPELLTRTVEVFGRTLAGLAMEGVDATLMVYEEAAFEEETEDDR